MNKLSNERIADLIARIKQFGHGAGYSADEVLSVLSELLACREAQGNPVVCEYGESNGDGSYSVVYGRYPIPSYIKVSTDWPIKLFYAAPQVESLAKSR